LSLDIRGYWSADRRRIVTLHLFYWIFHAIGAYQNVYLQSRGLSATTIGSLNSLVSFMTILIMPVWGLVSDRTGSVKRVFIVTLAAASALFAFLPDVLGLTINALPLFFAYNVLIYIFLNPYKSIFDNWTIRYCADKRITYGSVRVTGSVTWCLTGLAIAPLIAAYGTEWTFRVSGGGMLIVLLLACFTDDAEPATKPSNGERQSFSLMQLFRSYEYTVFLVFTLFMCLVVNTYMNYIPFALKELGLEPSLYGVLTASAAILEVPMMLGSGKANSGRSLVKLIVTGALLYGTCCLLIGTVVRSFAGMLIAVFISGLGNGLWLACAARYVYTLVPVHMKATGQSVYAAVTAVSGIISGLLAGVLIDSFTAMVFYRILAGISFFSALLLWAATLRRRHAE